MDFGLVAKLPWLFWLGAAVTLFVPYKLPRFGVVLAVIVSIPGVAMMFDTGVRWVALFNQIGTLLFLLGSLWIFAAAIGFSRQVPAGGVAASDSVASTTRLRPARFAA